MNLARLADVQDEIADGDLLLVRRGRSIVHRLIGQAGRSDYVHAALAAWWGEDLMCLETRGGRWARAVTLKSQVEAAPGRYDVFRSNPGDYAPSFCRPSAVGWMRRLCGRRYGWLNILRVVFSRMLVVRWLVPPVTDDQADGRFPPFCSQAVAMACRAGGVDPVPYLADRATEPGDLARSLFFRYRFTLTT